MTQWSGDPAPVLLQISPLVENEIGGKAWRQNGLLDARSSAYLFDGDLASLATQMTRSAN